MTTTVMRASAAQRSRTKTDEGLRLKTYPDTANIPTIGYGRAATNPKPVRGLINGVFYEGKVCMGLEITLAEADRLFDEDADETERGISALVTQDISQSQFDGLFDFVHQFGIAKFRESTLLVRVNFNPHSPSVLDEFIRWNRVNGKRDEAIWRRACRRAIIYNGTPIPQALYRKNGFPFVLTPDDQIDYSITPTIWKLIEYGKKAAEPYKFDPSKPLPTPDPIIAERPELDLSREATILKTDLPIPGPFEDELVLEEAAPIIAKSDVVGEVPVASQPPAASPASVSNTGVSKPASPAPSLDPIAPMPPQGGAGESLPPPPEPKLPPVPGLPPPKDPVPVDVTDAKDMVLSRRFWGLAVTAVGTTNFLPRGVQEWINHEGTRELLTWLIVVVVGFTLYKLGQKKATRPLK